MITYGDVGNGHITGWVVVTAAGGQFTVTVVQGATGIVKFEVLANAVVNAVEGGGVVSADGSF